MKHQVVILLMLIPLITGLHFSQKILSETDIGQDQTPKVTVYFCNPQNCSEPFTNFMLSAKACAFYDTKQEFINATPNLPIVIDKANKKHLTGNISTRKVHGLMHHKICYNDTHVLTGSTNPTHRGLSKNYNDIIIIHDTNIAQHYKTIVNNIGHRRTTTKAFERITVCTSPRNDCIKYYIDAIHNAQHNISMASFSFTHPQVMSALIAAKHRGVSITVITESQQCGKNCKAKKLHPHIATMYLEQTDPKLHHKFVVIDNDTLITGSMNPSKNGNNRNEENTLIIKDPHVAAIYQKRFNYLKHTIHGYNGKIWYFRTF